MLELAGQRFQTKTHTDGGRNPNFNERFRFINVTPKYVTELRVKVGASDEGATAEWCLALREG